jgi:hypothetical protein
VLIVNPYPVISFFTGFSPVKRVRAGTFAGTFSSQIGAGFLWHAAIFYKMYPGGNK